MFTRLVIVAGQVDEWNIQRTFVPLLEEAQKQSDDLVIVERWNHASEIRHWVSDYPTVDREWDYQAGDYY